jgi:predicted ATPase
LSETAKKKKQLVMLSGYSGTGKSSLARIALKKDTDALYAEGKFDHQSSKTEPYSAWKQIFGTICANILSMKHSQQVEHQQQKQQQQQQQQRQDMICNRIRETLGSELLQTLLRVFPILEEILSIPSCEYDGDDAVPQQQQQQQQQQHEESYKSNPAGAKFRFNLAFCRFMRVVCDELSCVTIVLDDLQWTDVPSLDLLDCLLTDRLVENLLIVAIYRSNEVDDGHPLSDRLHDWKIRSSNDNNSNNNNNNSDDDQNGNGDKDYGNGGGGRNFTIQEIVVDNLQFDEIVKFINDLLSVTDSRTLALASLCQKRTHGNVFFLTHFLIHLHSTQLLQYSFGALEWTWDINEIECKTTASENVVDLLLLKMQSLPKKQADVLRLIACLGASVEEHVLGLLWQEMYSDCDDTTEVEISNVLRSSLEASIADGYLLREGTDEARHHVFVHDKVQEAASLLTPTEEAQSFHKWVGQTLMKVLPPEDFESALFVVVNLLNEGTPLEAREERIDLAELNCRASNVAMQISAFHAASLYTSTGISLLGDNAFSENYDLALDLYSTGASAESCLGNTEKMEAYCQAVMQQTDISREDKLRVYTTWLASLSNRGYMKEAADQTLELLAEFNVRFPKNRTVQSFRILANIMKVKRGLKGNLIQTILELPVEKDPTRLRLLHLMSRLFVCLYYLHDDLMPLVMFRKFSWALQYGLNDNTPGALNTLAIIFAGILVDLQGGSKFAQAAIDLIPKVSPLVEGRTLFVAHSHGVVWTQSTVRRSAVFFLSHARMTECDLTCYSF